MEVGIADWGADISREREGVARQNEVEWIDIDRSKVDRATGILHLGGNIDIINTSRQ